MPDPLAYLWNLCRAPRHTYGTCAAPLGIPKEPMLYPIVQGKKGILGQFITPHLSTQIRDHKS